MSSPAPPVATGPTPRLQLNDPATVYGILSILAAVVALAWPNAPALVQQLLGANGALAPLLVILAKHWLAGKTIPASWVSDATGVLQTVPSAGASVLGTTKPMFFGPTASSTPPLTWVWPGNQGAPTVTAPADHAVAVPPAPSSPPPAPAVLPPVVPPPPGGNA